MSLIGQIFLMEKYGLRLNVEQIADVLDSTPSAIHRRISDRTFDINTYMDGKKRYADVRDVANYIDTMRDAAQRAAIPA